MIMNRWFARVRTLGTVVLLLVASGVPSTSTRAVVGVAGDVTLATLRAFKAGDGTDCLGEHLADMTITDVQVGLCLPTPSVMSSAPETPIGSFILTAYESTTGQYSLSTFSDRACQEIYGQTMGIGDFCLAQPQYGFTAVHVQFVPSYQPGQMQIAYYKSPAADCSAPPLARAQATPGVCGKVTMPFGYVSQMVTPLDQSSFNYSFFSDQACGASGGHILSSYINHFDECVVPDRNKGYAPPNFQIARTPTVAAVAATSSQYNYSSRGMNTIALA